MVVVYLCFALPNLGSTAVPETGWKPVKPGESFLVDLGKPYPLSRIYYYAGDGDGLLKVEYQDQSGEFIPLGTINKKEFYKWNYISVAAETDRLKFTVVRPGGNLLEIGIFARGDRQPVTSITIFDRNVHPLAEGSVENLFNEQSLIDYHPSFLTGTYFDEIYHARRAFEHLRGYEPYETTHPPLGKILIAVGIGIFGMNPFGWRIMGVLFGAAMIPSMYLFGKKIFVGYFYPFITAFLLMFDFMYYTLSRIATIDIYATFFIILMYYFLYDYFTRKSYLVGFKESLKPLFWCGLCFGLGVAVKWISLYAGASLALLFFAAKLGEYRNYRKARRGKAAEVKKARWVSTFTSLYINKTFLFCIMVFILAPALIYLLSYLPFMMLPGPRHGIKDVFTYQTHMFNYHSKLVATHPFSSTWWEWPLIKKPIWFYGGQHLPSGISSSIVSMGESCYLVVGNFSADTRLGIVNKKKTERDGRHFYGYGLSISALGLSPQAHLYLSSLFYCSLFNLGDRLFYQTTC